MALVIILACLLSASLAKPRAQIDLIENNGNAIGKEVIDESQTVQATALNAVSNQCPALEKLEGFDNNQVSSGKNEPDVNQLTLQYITNDTTTIYNITTAASSIPKSKFFKPNQELYIYAHGFSDDPSKESFTTVNNALMKTGRGNVLALDSSSLIGSMYLQASTYVRFIGEKLGEVLASLVEHGIDPAKIHLIGHGLGAHIVGFTGKTFTNITNKKVARITGLDPAGPCFFNLTFTEHLEKSDAKFVDVIHTDSGVFGHPDALGHVDYYPNGGSQQPGCQNESCNHGRSWKYYAVSLQNPNIFPASKCDSWYGFMKGTCAGTISYMGIKAKPGTTGKYFLQTSDKSPFGLGDEGTVYKNDKGLVRSIIPNK